MLVVLDWLVGEVLGMLEGRAERSLGVDGSTEPGGGAARAGNWSEGTGSPSQVSVAAPCTSAAAWATSPTPTSGLRTEGEQIHPSSW